MPTDTNLPSMVHLYLELVDKLNYSMTDIDTGTAQYKRMLDEISYYLGCIREELKIAARDEHREAYVDRFDVEAQT